MEVTAEAYAIKANTTILARDSIFQRVTDLKLEVKDGHRGYKFHGVNSGVVEEREKCLPQ
jgi:hypothetical protein